MESVGPVRSKKHVLLITKEHMNVPRLQEMLVKTDLSPTPDESKASWRDTSKLQNTGCLMRISTPPVSTPQIIPLTPAARV